jgi:hypothetical protein
VPTSVDLSASDNPAVYGEIVTFTAKVTPFAGVNAPTGTVRFYKDNILVDSEPLVPSADHTAHAAFTTPSPLDLGSYAITATYEGDDYYAGSLKAVTELVKAMPYVTLTTVAPSSSEAAVGKSVTFAATVVPAYDNSFTESHSFASNVAFYDYGSGITLLGTEPVVSGQATLTTSSLAPGEHNIVAVYLGNPGYYDGDTYSDPSYFTAKSGEIDEQIDRNFTATGPSTAKPGETLNYTVQIVLDGANMPTGTMTVTLNGNGSPIVLYQGQPGNAPITVSTTAPSPSSPTQYTIAVSYGGDSNYAACDLTQQLFVSSQLGRVFIVDPDGIGGTPSDNNPGTATQPLKTYYRARDLVQPGDTVELRGGTYMMFDPSQIGNERQDNLQLVLPTTPRQAGAPITFKNYPGETPILDFSEKANTRDPNNTWTWDANGWWSTVMPAGSIVGGDPVNDPVYVYRTDGQTEDCQLAVKVANYNDFLTPPSQFVSNGQLTVDLSYFDSTNRTVYWRPSALLAPPTDVANDLRLVSGTAGAGIAGTYVTMQGLTFQFGRQIQADGDHFQFLDNTVTNFFAQGLEGGGTNWLVQGNVIDRIAGVWDKSGTAYIPQNQSHSVYLSGQNIVLENNFIGRSFSGFSVHILSYETPTFNVTLKHNVIYAGPERAVLLQGNNFDVEGNLIFAPQADTGVEMYFLINGLTLSNNYVETSAASGASIDSFFAGPTTPVENFQITNNVFNAGFIQLQLIGNTILHGSTVSHNQWIDNHANVQNEPRNRWVIEVYGTSSELFSDDYNDYLSYVGPLGWETGSTFGTTTYIVDRTTVEGYLDASHFTDAEDWLWGHAHDHLGFSAPMFPEVTSIVRVDSQIANGLTTLHFTVNFNKAVTGVLAKDFVLSGDYSSGTISDVSGSGSTYNGLRMYRYWRAISLSLARLHRFDNVIGTQYGMSQVRVVDERRRVAVMAKNTTRDSKTCPRAVAGSRTGSIPARVYSTSSHSSSS